MRIARIKVVGRGAVYHCMSRVVGGQRLLGDLEKEKLRKMLWRQAQFSGVQVITYCLLANHFHLLIRVPAQILATDAELVARVRKFHGADSPYTVRLEEAMARSGQLPEDLREGVKQRLGDVSVFMKELKQRFSLWYNKQHERFGTLWAERFKSVLVEDAPSAVEAVAGYVDLNPVRAGLVEDPKEYRWCGYGEAMGGSREAREGLVSGGWGKGWEQVAREYRKLLWVKSGRGGRSGKVELAPERIREALKGEGALAMGQVLRLRVRYFSDGLVLGSRGFVNEMFGEFRDRFGPRRRSGARKMRGAAGTIGLTTIRDLQVEAVS